MKRFLLLAVITAICFSAQSQDSTQNSASRISLKKQKHYIPEVAALQSAMLPGLGQIYNRQYWKVPIALVAVGIPIRQHIKNRQWHSEAQFAIEFAHMVRKDPSKESLKEMLAPEYLEAYENSKNYGGNIYFTKRATDARKIYRQGMDYSILWALAMWGLNIIDATTTAHLKGFDITDDISMNIQPSFQTETRAAGLKMVFSYKK